MRSQQKEYHSFPESTYQYEANLVQLRINHKRARGISVPSDQIWAWIKERHPQWPELDWEKVFQLIKRM